MSISPIGRVLAFTVFLVVCTGVQSADLPNKANGKPSCTTDETVKTPAGNPQIVVDGLGSKPRNLWPAGYTLKINLLDGTQAEHEAVKTHAQEWIRPGVGANLHFQYYSGPHLVIDPDIAITFEGAGFNSAVGTQWRSSVGNRARESMRLGGLRAMLNQEREVKRVILHEFGHALGLHHEQHSPASGITLNDKKRSHTTMTSMAGTKKQHGIMS